MRREAEIKDEGADLLWVQDNKRIDESKDNLNRTRYMFSDHNSFVGKTITLITAQNWLFDSLVIVMNGGDPYFLTRNRKICERNNRKFEVWMHAKPDKLLTCLNVGVFIENPDLTPTREVLATHPHFSTRLLVRAEKKSQGLSHRGFSLGH